MTSSSSAGPIQISKFPEPWSRVANSAFVHIRIHVKLNKIVSNKNVKQ